MHRMVRGWWCEIVASTMPMSALQESAIFLIKTVLAASLLPLPSLKFSLLLFSHFLLSSSCCFPSPTPFLLSSSRCFPSPTSFSQVLKFLSSFCPPFYCSTVLTIFVIFSCKHLKCKQRPFFPTLIATTLTVLASD